MTRDELVSDLNYVRAMAEEGRHAPLLGGSFLLFWGVLNGIAYLTHWSILTGLLPGGTGGSGIGFAALWATYGVIAGVGSSMLGRRIREKPGKSAVGVRAEHAIWRSVGFALGAVIFGCLVRMLLDSDPLAPNGIMGPAFALFGAALATTAMMAGQKWLGAFAVCAFAAAGLLCAFANAPWAYLVASGASVLALAAPGVLLLRREPSPIV